MNVVAGVSGDVILHLPTVTRGHDISDSSCKDAHSMSKRPSLLIPFTWYFLSLAFIIMPPLIGALYVLFLVAAFAIRYMLRSSAREAYASEIGLYPLRPSLACIIVAVIASILAGLAFAFVYIRAVLPHLTSPAVVEAYRARPWGWLPFSILAVFGAAIFEEFIFRGAIQHGLYPYFRPVGAIAITAMLFALLHAHPWMLPSYSIMGFAAGLLVYQSGSIWAGVVLHACDNLVILVLDKAAAAYPILEPESGLMGTWIPVLVAVTSALCFVVAVRRIEPSPLAPSRP